MRPFVLLVIGLFLAGASSLSCNAIIGLQAPPQQDASMSSGSSGSSSGATSQNDATMTDTGGPETSFGDAANPMGKANGAVCRADGDCTSGHCTDGVCCNNACSGTCERCDLGSTKGTCTGIAVNTDPAMECVMVTFDAGAPAVDAGPHGASDTGEAGSSDEGGSAEAGVSIHFPDSGYVSSDKTCAGSCDGKGGNGGGSCVYPDTTKTCGTKFCNTRTESAAFACNGGGFCSLGLAECSKYSCTDMACGTGCTRQADCLQGYYCDSATTTCKPTFGNGLQCSSNSECKSGYCTTGTVATALSPVCCSTSCTIPGGSCVTSGSEGECICNVTCPAGGSCQVYYLDYDQDGYGDINGDPTGGATAYVGCSNVAPKAGYVADHTDCDDHDSNAHPGQTQYFGYAGRVNYDFNCDGTQEKETPEFPGGTCEFCSATPTCGATSATCGGAGEQSAFACSSRLICLPICRFCLGGGCKTYCWNQTVTAFQSTIACGATGTTTTCGTCNAAGAGNGTMAANSYTASVSQLCH